MTVLEAPADKVRGEVFNVGHSDENYTKRMVVEAVQEHLGGAGQVQFTEGGQDAAQLPRRVRQDPRSARLRARRAGSRRPPASLIEAIRAGAFDDVDQRPGFYTNHTIAGVHERRRGRRLMRAVILAGGKGTRLRPTRPSCPKPLVPVGDRPILELIIRQLARRRLRAHRPLRRPPR